MGLSLEELVFGRSFYDTGCSHLSAQARLTAEYEEDKLCQRALCLAAEKLEMGDASAALPDILYSQRRAPSNSLITFLVGNVRLNLRNPQAVEPFELLARRSGWSKCWYHLAYAHLCNGYPALAAGALHETLRHNAPLIDELCVGLANQIAKATDAAGWCGLNNSGQLYFGGRAATAARADLVATVDGKRLSLERHRGSYRTGASRAEVNIEIWKGRLIEVSLKGIPLIGSPIQIDSISRAEGFVDRADGAIAGWHWLPGEPSLEPAIVVTRADEEAPFLTQVAADLRDSIESVRNLSWQRGFHIAADDLPSGMLAIRDMRGRNLYGSPLNPNGERRSGWIAATHIAARFSALRQTVSVLEDGAYEISIPVMRAKKPAEARQKACKPREILVAIPVFRGYEVTMCCIRSVLRHRTSERILVVSDKSPDTRLVAELETLAARRLIEFRNEDRNRGFPATANLALRHAAAVESDIVLLNNDTVVAAGWLERLRAAAYSADDVGTATPFSNSATILSYPYRARGNALPDVEQVDQLAAAFFHANGDAVLDIPTGHGFCLYVRHACLTETGLLRDDVFAQGYGEENDFCMRARHLGWRHIAAAGVYVGHMEGQSFAKAKTDLIRRNLRTLNLLHPGYDSLIAEWEKRDPAAVYRRNVDWLRASESRRHRPAVGFVTHAREGGVLRQVQARARLAEQQHNFALILQPEKTTDGKTGCSITAVSEALPNLRFEKDETELLLQFLKEMELERVELHHFLGHDPDLVAALSHLEVPMDIHLHDYSWICPRITLTSHDNRYCGEPHVTICRDCVSDHGSNIEWDVTPRRLLDWSSDLFSRARDIIAPSEDTARRFSRRFGVNPTVIAWERDDQVMTARTIPPMGQGHIRKICLAGAIGYEKGYEVILGCARHAAANDIPLSFQIVGYTCDDARLLETGKVAITGRYDEEEVVTMIRDQSADFAFLPALWPETWSFVLSQLWEAGLPVVAFDIGAQAERIRRTGAGLLLPINLPIPKLVEALCRVSS